MKDINGYEGLYAITSCGKVWSYRNAIFLKPTPNQTGYLQVQLSKDGKTKHFYVHRLVLEAYTPVDGMEALQCGHLDEICTHNWLGNLAWQTPKENANWGHRNEKLSKAVICVESKQIYPSIKAAAAAVGCTISSIYGCCSGRQKTCAGYHWQYIETNPRHDAKWHDAIPEKQRKFAREYYWRHGDSTVRPRLLPVLCVETSVVYPSITEAAVAVGTSRHNISCCLTGKSKSAAGFHWQYVNQEFAPSATLVED